MFISHVTLTDMKLAVHQLMKLYDLLEINEWCKCHPNYFTDYFTTLNLSLKSKNVLILVKQQHQCVHTMCPYVKQSFLSHVGCFRNTVFSLKTCSGYAVNLQHIYFSINRQPCGFSQACQTNGMGCLFSIGLIF